MRDAMRYKAPIADVIQFDKDEIETAGPFFNSVQGTNESTGEREYSQSGIEIITDSNQEPD